MPLPRLTFYCELETKPLLALIDEKVIRDLSALHARVSLGILDLSPERAALVRQLNTAGIPLTAWLLLPKDEGYWFNRDNASQAVAFYQTFKAWTAAEGLKWSWIGLDIEPDIRDMVQLARQPWRLMPKIVQGALSRNRVRQAQAIYRHLVAQIHADGYKVESYQFPVIADERRAGGTLIQRATGLVDVPADQEVWMLYTSFLRPAGPGVLQSYAPEAPAVGLGSTGGGVETGLGDTRPLNWDELGRDLRLAWYWNKDIYIFSLEGCIRHGYLERLKGFSWDQPILLPEESGARVDGWRRGLGLILWSSANTAPILAGLFGLALFFVGIRHIIGKKRTLSG